MISALVLLPLAVGASVWPMPVSMSVGDATVAVPTDLRFDVADGSSSDDVTAAIARYADAWLFPHRVALTPGARGAAAAAALPQVGSVRVVVDAPDAELQLYANESYELSVPAGDGGAIEIAAATQFGLYRALETLSQLVAFDFDRNAYTVERAPVRIADYPRFPHRQLMIDTSRHYEPVRVIEQLVDACAFAKINTVHWHIVDSQSFPFDAPSHPELAAGGAYSRFERYTDADVAHVVAFARARGVRVMMEFDVPGHAASWCAGAPAICPSAACPEPLSPATNATFDLLADVLRDVTGGAAGAAGALAPEVLMHLGGDEVDTSCWTQSDEIVAWMDAEGYDASEAYLYFVRRAQQIARGMGREVVGWDEIWDNFGTSLDPTTIIANWRNINATDVTAHGYRMLHCPDPLWYLDSLAT